MAVSPRSAGPTRVGTGTRFRILGLVVFNVLLALVVSSGLVWLAGRPGVHQRIDLTEVGENTLDESLRQTLDRLPGEIELHTFFRPFSAPLQQVGLELQGRMFEILLLAEEYAPGRVSVTDHPYVPPRQGGMELLAEMRRFGLEDTGGVAMNTVVVAHGDRRTFIRLLGDVAQVDLGTPYGHRGAYRPPGIVSYRGQEALLKAILKVTQGAKPLALFSEGHGERKIFAEGDESMGRLHSALVADGFRVETWNADEDGPLSEECAVLAIVGAEEPLSSEALGWIATYVRRGGSIIAAPGLNPGGGQGSVADLLSRFGILMRPGFVARQYIGADGRSTDGDSDCAGLVIRADSMLARHPITEPLRQGDRRVNMFLARALERGGAPAGGVLLDLLRTGSGAWEDLPDSDGFFRWEQDEEREKSGPFTLAMASVFPPPEVGPLPPPGTNPERPECRVLAIGAPMAFQDPFFDTNRDFLLNAFNWAASREFRVSITPRQRDDRRLELGQTRALFTLNLIALWGLPLLCLSLGVFTLARRRR